MPGDTGLPGQMTDSFSPWPIYFSRFDRAWDLPPEDTGKSMGKGITIAHPDTGYTEHPELVHGGRYLFRHEDGARNFIGRFNERQRDGDNAEDDLRGPFPLRFPSHGTGTASAMLSEYGHPNANEVHFPDYDVPFTSFASGAAPRARVLPLRVTRNVALDGEATAALARAIHYATTLTTAGVGVISISLGCVPRIVRGGVGMPLGSRVVLPPNRNLVRALENARRSGVIVCAAAGQLKPFARAVTEFTPPQFPGNSPHTICAAACDYWHRMDPSGFYGSAVDITVPGVNVWAARSSRRHGYTVFQSTGSSYAAAMTAGACALWQAHHGRDALLDKYGAPLLFDAFKTVLTESSDNRGGSWNSGRHGYGVLNAEKLLRKALPPRSRIDEIARLAGWTVR